ncbi:MAG TPA: NAD(+)/NADH kinase [Candidatus Angelobacter sp.]|nr:NAD(+)/NADH kinase [Candidatus Angelobacter sp.]
MKKLADKIKRVGLIANSEKINCRAAVQKAAALISDAGRVAACDKATAQLADLKGLVCSDARHLARETELVMVFGGDGTMLRVAREVAGSDTPILGINVGGLGFLTAVPSEQLSQALSRVWAGDFVREPRSLIEATARAREKTIRQVALNDFVVSRGAVPRLIELEVRVDDAVLTRYRCDGIIVSSPTGSTAYSLAAGGAIVNPDADVFTLTPICPHTLSNRSVIVGLNSIVQVRVLSPRVDGILSADGQVQTQLTGGDTVTIRRSQRAVRLVRLTGASFFETLRQKLHWSGSNV